MKTFDLIMYIVAALMFLAGAVTASRPNTSPAANPLTFVSLGLLAWVMVPLVAAINALN